MSGRQLGVATARDCQKVITLNYVATSVTQKIFIIPTSFYLLTHIQGVTRVAGSGGACTFSFYKAPSAIAVASGTLLHTGTFDLVGTADTNQSITLLTDQSALTFAAGDALGVALTGTATSAVGTVTFTFEPLNN